VKAEEDMDGSAIEDVDGVPLEELDGAPLDGVEATVKVEPSVSIVPYGDDIDGEPGELFIVN